MALSEREELEQLRAEQGPLPQMSEREELEALRAEQGELNDEFTAEDALAYQDDLREGTMDAHEAIRSIGREAIGTIASGYAGIAALSPVGMALGLTDSEKASRAVQSTREIFSATPEREGAQEMLQTIGDLAEQGVDMMNVPVANVAEFVEMISGATPEEAQAVSESIKEKGFPATFGDSVFEKTNNPMLAALAYTAPHAAIEFLTGSVPSTVSARSAFKTKVAESIQQGNRDSRLAGVMSDGAGGLVKDGLAKEAIRQGFDAGVITAVRGGSKTDKSKMGQMVQILDRGKTDALFSMKNRPSDVAGLSLLDRVNHVKAENLAAGKEIDAIAKGLKGQPIDVSAPSLAFAEQLDGFGIRVSRGPKGFRPDFSDSALAKGDHGTIQEVLRQMNRIDSKGPIDALAVHQMKRIIDRNVTFGKRDSSLSREAEGMLKEFRSGLDEALDSTYPEYNQANVRYADTIEALNNLQDAAGSKMDLAGPNSDKAVGTLLRRLMGNAQSRVNLLDAVTDMERTATKYGGKFEDSVELQMLFADELDNVFGPSTRTSFKAEIGKEVQRGVAAAATGQGFTSDLVNKGIELSAKARGVNSEKAVESIMLLLQR